MTEITYKRENPGAPIEISITGAFLTTPRSIKAFNAFMHALSEGTNANLAWPFDVEEELAALERRVGLKETGK